MSDQAGRVVAEVTGDIRKFPGPLGEAARAFDEAFRVLFEVARARGYYLVSLSTRGAFYEAELTHGSQGAQAEIKARFSKPAELHAWLCAVPDLSSRE